jgi:hypothetical protein
MRKDRRAQTRYKTTDPGTVRSKCLVTACGQQPVAAGVGRAVWCFGGVRQTFCVTTFSVSFCYEQTELPVLR